MSLRSPSFAGNPKYLVPGMAAPYASPPRGRGPPLSSSAYRSPQYSSYIPPSIVSAMHAGHTSQELQSYEGQQRPTRPPRSTSNHGHTHSPPIITQADSQGSKYSARYGQPPESMEHSYQDSRGNMPKPKLLQYGSIEDYESSSASSDEEEEEEYDERTARRGQAQAARALMPPPKLERAYSQRRPSLIHAKTTQVVERFESDRREERRQSRKVPNSVIANEREQRASVSRPPPHRQTQSEYNTHQARVTVGSSSADRRTSYNTIRHRAPEDQYDAERKREKHASNFTMHNRHIPGQFLDDEEEEEFEYLPVSMPNRRPGELQDEAAASSDVEQIYEDEVQSSLNSQREQDSSFTQFIPGQRMRARCCYECRKVSGMVHSEPYHNADMRFIEESPLRRSQT
jgi:hypothetical protein